MTDGIWQRSETRTVRPFAYSEHLLEGCSLRLTSAEDFNSGELVDASRVAIRELTPQIRLDYNASEVESEVGIPPEDLLIIAAVEDRTLKHTQIACREQADESCGRVITVPMDVVRTTSWSCDTRISVTMVLCRERTANMGLATRFGHWVARKVFRITGARNVADFPIQIVDSDYFSSTLGLPRTTTYFVDVMAEDFNQPPAALPDLVRVYVNQDVSQVLYQAENSAAGKALIRTIYSDVVSTILSVGFGQSSEADLLPDSILSLVAEKLSKAAGVSRDGILEMATKSPGACRLRAVIQAEAGLTKALATARF